MFEPAGGGGNTWGGGTGLPGGWVTAVATLLLAGDPLDQDAQVVLEQHDLRRFLGHIHGAVHGDAHVGHMEGRGVVDAVAQESDHVAALAQGQDDALLLVRLDLGEYLGALRPLGERPVAQLPQLGAGDHLGRRDADLAGQVDGDARVVSRDQLEPDAGGGEVGEGLPDLWLGRVEEGQEAEEGHLRLLLPRDDLDEAGGFRRERADRDAERAEAVLGERREPGVDPGPHLLQRHLAFGSLRLRADLEHLG